MEIKRVVLLIFCAVFLILNSKNIYASSLGLTPAIIDQNFEPNGKFLASFNVLGASENQDLSVFAEGDFAEYVTFDKTNFTGGNTFTAYIDLPAQTTKYGKNKLYIKVKEVFDIDVQGIGTKLEIGALIIIRVPYPGKYAEIRSLEITTTNENESVIFISKVENMGSQDITANVSVDIFSEEQLIESIFLGSKEILFRGTKSFAGATKGYKAGVYNATAIVDYKGDVKAEKEKQFKVGSLFVDIINWTSEIIQGKISEFEIEIESKWNNDIENVYAEVNISKKGGFSDFFKTPSVKLGRWETGELTGFVNAENLESGKYEANITLFYEGKTTGKIVNVEVVKGELNATIMKYVVFAVIGVLVILIVIIVIIVLLLKINKLKKINKSKRIKK
jgi:hypothetical protein